MPRNRTLLLPLLLLLALAGCSQPAPESWESIPILAGALEVEQTESTYTYTVDSALSEIEGFYTDALPADGWEYAGLGEGIGGLFMVFNRGTAHLKISAIRENNGGARVELNLLPRD